MRSQFHANTVILPAPMHIGETVSWDEPTNISHPEKVAWGKLGSGSLWGSRYRIVLCIDVKFPYMFVILTVATIALAEVVKRRDLKLLKV